MKGKQGLVAVINKEEQEGFKVWFEKSLLFQYKRETFWCSANEMESPSLSKLEISERIEVRGVNTSEVRNEPPVE